MRRIRGLIMMLIISLGIFGGCSGDAVGESKSPDISGSDRAYANGYEQISGEEAKKLMDSRKDYIILDARTSEEFNEGHIEGALLIPEYEIEERAEAELPRKDQLILVYCRSGRRSKIAAQALADSGYTNVKEFGGIIDWEYEIVK